MLGVLGKEIAAEACSPVHFQRVREDLAKRYNLNGQAKRIGHVRSMFELAYEDQVIDKRPNFGRSFKRPVAKALRKLRAVKGDQSFAPEEIHALVEEANVNLKAKILLGIQAGMGNEDCAALPRSAIKEGWVHWARVKTSVSRRFPLWPKTREAIDAAIEHANSKGESELSFVGARGTSFITGRKNGYQIHGVFVHARDKAKVNCNRTFYDLRRTFATVASETADQVAVDAIVGHTPSENDMSARYRQRISDDRLRMRPWICSKKYCRNLLMTLCQTHRYHANSIRR